MADAVPNIEEELRKRGLLATGGNIRMLPFSDASTAGVNNAPVPTNGTGSATANALGVSNGGGVTVNDVNGNPVVVDPNSTQLPANVPDEEWLNLWPALAGAGGAALALLIKNHLASKGVNLPTTAEGIPTMEGTVEPNGVPDPNANIVDGEFSEVDRPRIAAPSTAIEAAGAVPAIQQQRALPAPPPTLKDSNASGARKNLTAEALKARRVAARKQGIVPIEGTGPTLVGNDSYADLSEAEMKQARTIADQLIQQRIAGRHRRYVKGKTDVGRKGLPTLPIDKEGALNIVVRAIRDAKLNPNQVRKAVGR